MHGDFYNFDYFSIAFAAPVYAAAVSPAMRESKKDISDLFLLSGVYLRGNYDR